MLSILGSWSHRGHHEALSDVRGGEEVRLETGEDVTDTQRLLNNNNFVYRKMNPTHSSLSTSLPSLWLRGQQLQTDSGKYFLQSIKYFLFAYIRM